MVNLCDPFYQIRDGRLTVASEDNQARWIARADNGWSASDFQARARKNYARKRKSVSIKTSGKTA